MRRGTTPTIELEIPFKADEISVLWVTFAQGGTVPPTEILTKANGDAGVNIEDGLVTIGFTQEDTLLFAKTGLPKVQLQIRVLLTDGTADASNIVDFPVGLILRDRVIG